MPAVPARPLLTIRHDSTIAGSIGVTLIDRETDDWATVPLTDLSRAELCRVVKRIGSTPKDRRGVWKTNDEILSEIRELIGTDERPRSIANDRDAAEPTPAPTPMPEPTPTPEPADAAEPTPMPEPTPAPTRPTTSAAAAAQALIDALAAQQTQTLDVDQVRSIARDVAETVALELIDGAIRPMVIQIPDVGEFKITEQVHKDFERVCRMVGVGVHPMLVGPAGTGKSTLAHQVANALQRPFGAISLHPQIAASQLFGFIDASGTYRGTPFRECYEHGGVFLFDEIDNGHPGVLAGINQALANGECAFADGMVKRHDDFVAIAAANTFGTGPNAQYVGRNQLDAATLDRFARVELLIDEKLETSLVRAVLDEEPAHAWLATVRAMRANVDRGALRVIVSPRTSIEGAKLIRAGFTPREAADAKVLSGLSADLLAKVVDGVKF